MKYCKFKLTPSNILYTRHHNEYMMYKKYTFRKYYKLVVFPDPIEFPNDFFFYYYNSLSALQAAKKDLVKRPWYNYRDTLEFQVFACKASQTYPTYSNTPKTIEWRIA